MRFTETVALEGLNASIGSVGDAYDNAAAETVMGLFENDAIAKNSPFRVGPLKTIEDVEEITFEGVTWYNNERLHGYLGNIRPEEYERNYMLEDTAHRPVTPPTKRRRENRDGSRKHFARCWVPSISSWLGPVNRALPRKVVTPLPVSSSSMPCGTASVKPRLWRINADQSIDTP